MLRMKCMKCESVWTSKYFPDKCPICDEIWDIVKVETIKNKKEIDVAISGQLVLIEGGKSVRKTEHLSTY